MSPRPYDPFDPACLDDPYDAYRELRDHDPVHHFVGDGTSSQPPFWVLSRFADIDASLRDPDLFSSAQGLTFFPDEIASLGLAPTIVMMDPPEHTRKRKLMARAFTPKRVAATEPDLRAYVRDRLAALVERSRDGEEVDLHQDFSSRIPTFVLGQLLGVPPEESTRFDPWVRALVTLGNAGFSLGGLPGGAVAAVTEMFEYFTSVIEQRRRAPGEDLISALTLAEIDGERLSDWDILGFCFVIVAGGNDTTGNLISHTVLAMQEAAAQRAQVVGSPNLIPQALMEVLRLESSVQGLARTTTRDVTLHGTTIPAGEKVLMLFGSGNRDEREFGPTAGQLDIHRTIDRHLGFGQGPHFCIGSHFARLQARVAIEELYAAHPDLTVDPARAVRLRSPFTRGFEALPLRGDAR